MCLVINRYDLCPDISSEIIKSAGMDNIPVIGRIPYDPLVVTAVRKGIPAIYNDGKASKAIHQMVENLISELKIYGTSHRCA
jgi:MinD superfamily P-loop ATPase